MGCGLGCGRVAGVIAEFGCGAVRAMAARGAWMSANAATAACSLVLVCRLGLPLAGRPFLFRLQPIHRAQLVRSRSWITPLGVVDKTVLRALGRVVVLRRSRFSP